MVVIVMLKSKKAAGITSSGEIVKVRDLWSTWKLKKSAQAANRWPSHIEHMSVLLPFEFPASGK